MLFVHVLFFLLLGTSVVVLPAGHVSYRGGESEKPFQTDTIHPSLPTVRNIRYGSFAFRIIVASGTWYQR